MSEDVQIGIDGWLFLKGGTNEAERYYKEKNFFSQDDFRKWCDMLELRNIRISALGSQYYHFLAPEKISVYPEYYGAELEHFDNHPIRAFSEALVGKTYWINVLAALQNEKSKTDKILYHKTDSHWSYAGCFAAYVEICQKVNAIPDFTLLDRQYTELEMALDLGGKLNPPIKEKVKYHNVLCHAKPVYKNPVVINNERLGYRGDDVILNTSYIAYRNEHKTADKRKVIIFGDSFCEIRPHLLTGMMCETFCEVYFVWGHSIDFKLIERVKPDIVISEVVERFVNRVPFDGQNVEEAAIRRLSEKVGTTNS